MATVDIPADVALITSVVAEQTGHGQIAAPDEIPADVALITSVVADQIQMAQQAQMTEQSQMASHGQMVEKVQLAMQGQIAEHSQISMQGEIAMQDDKVEHGQIVEHVELTEQGEIVLVPSEIPQIEAVDEETERDVNDSLGLNEQVVTSTREVVTTNPVKHSVTYRDRLTVDEETERGMNESLGLNEQVVASTREVTTTNPVKHSVTYRDRTLNVSYEIQRGSSKRGRDKLIDSLGFTYNYKPLKNTKTITWTCSVRSAKLRCPATVLQHGNVFMRGSKKHEHFLGEIVAKPDGRASKYRSKRGVKMEEGITAWGIQDYRIIKHGSKHGMDILKDSLGYTYTFKRTAAGGCKTYWTCSVRNKNVRCDATVIQFGTDKFIEGPHKHKHLPAYNIPAENLDDVPSLRQLHEEREDADSDLEEMGGTHTERQMDRLSDRQVDQHTDRQMVKHTDRPSDIQEHSYGSTSTQTGSVYLNTTKMMMKKKTALVHEKKRREHETFLGPQCTINLSKCDDVECNCQLVHCPFCDPSHFKPTKAGRVQDHLELTHFAHGVQYDDLMIVKCFKECDIEKNIGHYHCVFCPQQIIKRSFYARHMLRHLRSMGVPERLLMLPDSKYPDIINAYGYEIPICKKTTCSPEGDKHFHCPVCSKVCQQRSLTVNHLWRCFQRQQGNTDDLSDGDETEIVNLVDDEQIVVHFSHAKSPNDIQIIKSSETDGSNQKYQCIMCPEDVFIPSYKQQLLVHYMAHWKFRIAYKNLGIMRCFQPCLGPSLKSLNKLAKYHFHCPICTKIIQTKLSFEDHIKTCHMLRFGENLIQSVNPYRDSKEVHMPIHNNPVPVQEDIEFLEDQLIAQSKAYTQRKSLEKKKIRQEKRNQRRKEMHYTGFVHPHIKQEIVKMEDQLEIVKDEHVGSSEDEIDVTEKIKDSEIFQTCTAQLSKRCMKTIWSREHLQSMLGEVAGKTETNLTLGDKGFYQLTGPVGGVYRAQNLIKQAINGQSDSEADGESDYTHQKKRKMITSVRAQKMALQNKLKAQAKLTGRRVGSKVLAKKVLTTALQKSRAKANKHMKGSDTFPYSEIKEIIKATKRKLEEKPGAGDEEDEDVDEDIKPAVRGRGRPRKSEVEGAVDTEISEETNIKRGRGRPRKSESGDSVDASQPVRGRGRPRKSEELDPDSDDTGEENVVIQRGRGRPRKYVEPDQDSVVGNEESNVVPRGRGRPRKYVELDQDAEVTNEESNTEPRGRGRPRKSEIIDNVDASEDTPVAKRGRGRPRKSGDLDSSVSNEEETEVVHKGRGRPRKSDTSANTETPKTNTETPQTAKRGRGRPPKHSPAQSTEPKSEDEDKIDIVEEGKMENKSVKLSQNILASPDTPKRYGTRGIRRDYAGMNSGIGIIEIKDEPEDEFDYDDANDATISAVKRKRNSLTQSPTGSKKAKIDEVSDVEHISENELDQNDYVVIENDGNVIDFESVVKQGKVKKYSEQSEKLLESQATEIGGDVKGTAKISSKKDGQSIEDEIKSGDDIQDDFDMNAEVQELQESDDDNDSAEKQAENDNLQKSENEPVNTSNDSVTVDTDSNKGRTVHVPLTYKTHNSSKASNVTSQDSTGAVDKSNVGAENVGDVPKPALKFPCSYCNKKFAFKSNLEDHENKHTGATPYECDICGKGYPSQSLLMKHKTLVHTSMRPFKCHICHRSFRFMNILQSHMSTHNKRMSEKYECSKCNKMFSNQSTLKYHQDRCGDDNILIYTRMASLPADVINTLVTDYNVVEETVEETNQATEMINASTTENVVCSENIVVDTGGTSSEVTDSLEDAGDVELYACSECNSMFNTLAEAENHILNDHPVVMVNGQVLMDS